MADIKWSAFPSSGDLATGDILVGLRAGANVQTGAITIPWEVSLGGTGLSTTTANQLLYSSATDTIAGLTTANNGLLVTSAAGVPSIGNAILADITVNGVTVGLGASSISTNVVVGGLAGASITTGSSCVIIGNDAGSSITSGSGNTLIGQGVATNAPGVSEISDGSLNTIIGHEAGGTSGSLTGGIAIGYRAAANTATGATSGDDGPGIAIGSAAAKVGFRGDGTIYPGAFGRVKWNGTQYMLPLQADGATAIAVTSGGTGLSSTTANQLLYSSATDTIAGLTTANNGILSTDGSGVPAINNTVNLVGQLNVDNLRLDGNTLSSTDTNGPINLTPNGTGKVTITNDATINTLNFGLGLGGIASNLQIGSTGSALTTGTSNIGIGLNTLSSLTTGSRNIVIGEDAGLVISTGNDNIALGWFAYRAGTTGSGNFCLGRQALGASNGSSNVAIGRFAFVTHLGGNDNVAIGQFSAGGTAAGSVAITSSSSSVFIGANSGANNATANGVIAIGYNSVANIATGATSGDDGPGIAIGSAAAKVGFRGDGTIYPTAGAVAGYMVQKINGTEYKVALYDLT